MLSNLRLLNRYRQACLDREVLDHLEAQVPAAGIELAALLSAFDFEDAGSLRVCTSFISWPRGGSVSIPALGLWTIRPSSFPEV